jgi:hypothetical protein
MFHSILNPYLTCLSEYSETTDAESIIRMTLPTKSGQRNDCVMKLARGLKFNAGTKDIDPASLRKVVERWHSLALPVITSKSFSETWRDFIHAFDTARFPLGLNLVDMAAGKVDPLDLPESAAAYDDEPTRKLIGLCWALASISGGEKFFLSSHVAAPRIGISQMQTWRLLRMLEVDGVINCMDRGNAHRAGRYKWIGGRAKDE